MALRRGSSDLTAPFAAIAIMVCAAPALAVLASAVSTRGDLGVSGALLVDASFGTIGLVLIGATGAIVLGASAAWLVSLCAFPGRGLFEWLLVLPLAAPSYLLAFAYGSLTWPGGLIDLPVAGFWGAAFVYAIGLYPYVYLAMRAGFAAYSASALEAARTLGAGPLDLFWRVALPLSRPSLVAGGALAAMEIAADYGAAQHFGLTTLSTAIFRVWYSNGAPGGALQIAAPLLLVALALLVLERRSRGAAAYASPRRQANPRFRLSAAAQAGACVFCLSLVALGAAAPMAWLGHLALQHGGVGDLIQPLLNTVALATAGAAITLVLAIAIAATAARANHIARLAPLAASVGYAAPGAVIALGALSLFAAARAAGWAGGLGAGLALTALLWTYSARFAAAGAQPVEAGLARVSKNVRAAAATLGANAWRRLIKIELPIAAPSLVAGGVFLFVEIVKELPATLILRPLAFDTLAVRTYLYASDERMHEAAAPALLIFAAGLLPIVFLARRAQGRS